MDVDDDVLLLNECTEIADGRGDKTVGALLENQS
jgi:hypothetical protein